MILRSGFALVLVGILGFGCARFKDKPLSAAGVAEQFENRTLNDARFEDYLARNGQDVNSWPLRTFNFEALTLAAFYFHPSLDVARAQWASSKAGVKTAGGRPNPVLTATPGYSANPARGVSPWFPSVSIDVPIETAGKRGYRIAHAEQLSEVARLNVAVTAWQVRSAVRAALLEYGTAHRRAAILETNALLQGALVSVLEQRLAAGAAAGPDVSPARINLIKLRSDAMEARRLALEARGKIAESIGVPLRAIEGVDFRMEDDLGEAGASSAELRRQALQGRADVMAALSEYAAARSALQLEIAKQYPDLHLNPGYQFDQGENKWALGLSVELPVLNRNQGPIAEAKARRDELAVRFAALQAKIIAELDRAELLGAAAREQMGQAEELLRVQKNRFAETEGAFRAGAADQFDLAAARVELAAAESAILDARTRRQQAAGALEDALQRPLAAIGDVGRDPKLEPEPVNTVSKAVTKETR